MSMSSLWLRSYSKIIKLLIINHLSSWFSWTGFTPRGGRGGGRGGRGGFRQQDFGPPERVDKLGHMSHTCQDDLVLKVTQTDVPYFNAPIYLENKQQIGKIDEIFGTLRDYYVSVKLQDDVKAKSFKKGEDFFIGEWYDGLHHSRMRLMICLYFRSCQTIAIAKIFARWSTKTCRRKGTWRSRSRRKRWRR